VDSLLNNYFLSDKIEIHLLISAILPPDFCQKRILGVLAKLLMISKEFIKKESIKD